MEIETSWSKALEIGDSWFKDFCVYAHISVYITSNKNIELGPNVKILLAFDIEHTKKLVKSCETETSKVTKTSGWIRHSWSKIIVKSK